MAQHMTTTYSDKYQSAESASKYDEVICRSDDDPVWAAEQMLLRNLIRAHLPTHNHALAVDFACGSGRILEVLQPMVGRLIGIDISDAMLARASKRIPHATLLHLDVTADPASIPRDIDLLTSFRFLLLAEPKLREACLRALVSHVSPCGILILNSHGNPLSFRFIATLRDRLLGRARRLQSFSKTDMTALARASGLDIIDMTGCGFVPMTLQRWLPPALCKWIERSLAGKPVLWRFGTNLLFVLKRCTQNNNTPPADSPS